MASPAAEAGVRHFDIPAGVAEQTLKRFAVQAVVQLVYPTDQVRGIRTNAVQGDFRPVDALEKLLAGTPLIVVRDEKPDAFAIRIDPNADRAALRESSDRPETPTAASSTNPNPQTMTTNRRTPAFQRVMGAFAALIIGGATGSADPAAGGTSAGAHAREGYGVVAGRVQNEATKDYLKGASIRIENSSFETVSSGGGEFNLAVPPGHQVVLVDYAGLKQARVSIMVRSGKTTFVDVPLNSDIYVLETFTVTGLREGQAAAIQEQRHAMNVKSMAAIDAYGNPGASTGELIQRLSGVAVDIGAGGEPNAIYLRGMSQNFTSMMVDGAAIPQTDGQSLDARYTTLGTVSTNNLEALEVIKAPLPDMDANAIAGYINLRTKRAFDKAPGQDVAVTVGTKWADTKVDKSVPGRDLPKIDLLTLSYTNVFSVLGRTNNLGVAATFSQISGAGYAGYTHLTGPWVAGSAANPSGDYFIMPPTAGGPPVALARFWGDGHVNTNTAQNFTRNFGLNFDYKAGPNTVLWLKTTLSDVGPEKGAFPGDFRWYLQFPQTSTSFKAGSTYDLIETNPVGTVNILSRLYVQERRTTGLSAGLEQKYFSGTGVLTLEGTYNDDTNNFPAINEAYATLSNVGIRFDRRGRDPWVPAITQIAGPNWSDPANYTVMPYISGVTGGVRRVSQNAPATYSTLKLDFKMDLATARPMYFKVGAKRSIRASMLRKTVDSFTWQGGGTPATGGITKYLGPTIKVGQNGAYGPIPMLQVPGSGLPGDIWNDPSNFYQTGAQAWISEYQQLDPIADVRQVLDATYAMGQVKFGKLRVLGGVRMEFTNNKATASRRRQVTDRNNPEYNVYDNAVSLAENARRGRANYPDMTTRKSDYRNVFPGLHLVYQLSKNFQAHTSYNTSITRPSPAETSGKAFVNDTTRSISKQNEALKPYTSDNFDFRLEYYLGSIGQVSAGVFLKEIKNYFRSFTTVVPEGPDNGFEGLYAGYSLGMNRNVGNARIRGAEFEYVQQLNFLPDWARGFSVNANATFLDTKGDFGTLAITTKLPNFTPKTFNAGLNYHRDRVDVRLLANYRGRTFVSNTKIANFGAAASGGWQGPFDIDLYNDSRLTYDVKTSFRINRVFSLYFDVYNLTNEYSLSRSFDLAGQHYLHMAQREGTIYQLSVKAKF
ncbi:MAG: TonB-dependent receptor [Opitutae bacterium]|nr:TonB-dependent receptor [Opitutae bacterium]